MTARVTSFATALTRALRGAGRIASAVLLLAFTASEAGAQAVKGDVNVSTKDGYARIVIHLEKEVESTVKVAGGIIVVSFKQPVDAPIEKVTRPAQRHVGAARRAPDGGGFRIALARKVTVNSMAAGERLFIDLLPENWTGVAPGLPQSVIEELASRAGVPWRAAPVSEAQLRSADEICISAATREVQPVTRLDGRAVGTGRPGPVFRLLYDAFQKLKRELAKEPW